MHSGFAIRWNGGRHLVAVSLHQHAAPFPWCQPLAGFPSRLPRFGGLGTASDIGGAEQRPMPVGALLPDKCPAGGASNIGVRVLKELQVTADPLTLSLRFAAMGCILPTYG